jgi:hypothetical protein
MSLPGRSEFGLDHAEAQQMLCDGSASAHSVRLLGSLLFFRQSGTRARQLAV